MASRTRSRSRGLRVAAGPTSRTASAGARASRNATAYESDAVVQGISMPNPLRLALDYSRRALIGQRGSGVWHSVQRVRPILLQVAELGPEVGVAESVAVPDEAEHGSPPGHACRARMLLDWAASVRVWYLMSGRREPRTGRLRRSFMLPILLPKKPLLGHDRHGAKTSSQKAPGYSTFGRLTIL